jgi:hypothetical protein
MRKTVRIMSAVGPTERLGRAIEGLPPQVQRVLGDVAGRADLPLASGSWEDDDGGCLVANAVACVARATPGRADDERTLDLRMLDAFPAMSSRDLNALIVAWDEAAAQDAATGDAELRRLLVAALRWAGVAVADPAGDDRPGDDRSGDVAGHDDAVGVVGHGPPVHSGAGSRRDETPADVAGVPAGAG